MARYKGRQSAKQIERDYPHHVDVPIPEGGLGTRLDHMHEWHRAQGIQSRRGSGGLSCARFCFADTETAEAFRAEFAPVGD